MDLILNNQRKSCSTVNHIEINNITDFEIQNENKTSKIAAHTISKDWANTMDNVFNSETDMLDKYDIITSPPKESIIGKWEASQSKYSYFWNINNYTNLVHNRANMLLVETPNLCQQVVGKLPYHMQEN